MKPTTAFPSSSTGHERAARREALEARLGLRIAGRLSERCESLPPDITERLRVAREQAVARAKVPARQAELQMAVAGRAGVLMRQGPGAWFGSLGFWAASLALLVGLNWLDQREDEALTIAAAEIDAVLLADDLPPNAYADPGFVAFLRREGNP